MSISFSGPGTILYLCGCAGGVHFEVWEEIECNVWKHTKTTRSYGGVYNYSNNYKLEDINGRCLDGSIGDYNTERQCENTAYDDYMIYWTLQGKKCKDFCGWTYRVARVKFSKEGDILYV